MPVDPVERRGRPLTIDNLPVVAPRVRIERGVTNGPHRASAKSVGTGPRENLDLPVATAHLRIHGRENHSELANHVGINQRRRANTCGITSFLYAQTVTYRIDHRSADPCERCRFTQAL